MTPERSHVSSMLLLVSLAWLVSACIHWKSERPKPWPQDGNSVQQEPDPTIDPVLQMTHGRIVLLAEGLDQVNLRPERDVAVLGHLTWEQEGLDANQPILELVLRGTSAEPCLEEPCRGKMELQVRVTRNLAWDRSLDWAPADPSLPATAPVNQRKLKATLAQSCGAGADSGPNKMPIGRLVAGARFLIVDVDCSGVTVATSDDGMVPGPSVRIPARKLCSYGFGRVLTGAPWPRSPAAAWRGWYWRELSSGASLTWVRQEPAAGAQPALGACP